MKDLPELLQDAVNVYRTKNYIVKQDLYIDRNIDGDDILYSNDTFYLRNKNVDKLYEMKILTASVFVQHHLQENMFVKIWARKTLLAFFLPFLTKTSRTGQQISSLCQHLSSLYQVQSFKKPVFLPIMAV